MILSKRLILTSLAVIATMVAAPASAQLRYNVTDGTKCGSYARSIASDIYYAKKLKADQAHWSDQRRAVVPYDLGPLQRERSATEERLGRSCTSAKPTVARPWQYSWSYDRGERFSYN